MKIIVRGKLLAMILTLALIISLVTALTIDAAALTEQFTLTPGGTYYFDLSSKLSNIKYDNTSKINTALPDESLKWVPFTYAGTLDAYSRTTAGVSDSGVTASARSLFISDYAVSTNVSWDGLNLNDLIFGCNYTTNGITYNLRSLSMGSANNGQSGDAVRGQPQNNEWDQVLSKNSSYIKYQYHIFCWGQDTLSTNTLKRVGRSWEDIRYFGNNGSSYRDAFDGFRPVLEILNADKLGSNSLKTVTYDMGENGKIGSSTGNLTKAAVVYTGELTLPAVTGDNGFYYTGTVPPGKTLGWLDSSGKFYAAGTKLLNLTTGITLTAGYDVTVPTVTAISPTNGPLVGGASVTITGTNFTGVNAVKFGGIAATDYTVNSATQITAIPPAGSAGTVDVTVTTAGGTSEIGSADQYTYVATSTAITGSASNVTSTTATINGTINPNNTSTSVTFEYGTTTSYGSTVTATQSPVTGASATSVSCTLTGLTPNTTYYFRVKSTNSAGTTNGSEMNFTTSTAAPTVTAISPNSGSIKGGTSVTISGTNLTGATSVTVGGNAATAIKVVNATTITATTPAGAAGTANVVVTTPGGTGTGTGLFTYVAESSRDSTTTATSTIVELNGQKQDAGTSKTEMVNGKVLETITVDATKLDKLLGSSGMAPKVTLPGSTSSAGVIGVLTGQTVKNMEQKEAVLEIKTDSVTYKLPASQINIDSVSSQIGSQVELKDIKVNVKIAEPSADTVKVVENIASKSNYQLVVKPVEFEITCTSAGKTVEISKFNGYVERTVAIPDGVDPKKITTGIVLNADGTFSHVPTLITSINGKYYAKISSLTSSTYSIIWNPVTFTDVANHWAKNAVNDMGSRMVVTGVGNGTYEPDRIITRAEFVAIVVRAMGLRQGTTESPFEDVSLTDWYNGYLDTATEYNLITGYDNTTFVPYTPMTREQAMTLLARAMKLTGLKESLTVSEVNTCLTNFTDGSSVSDYAKTAAAICIKTGIVSGSSATTLSPKAYVTRAEVAVMVQRLLQKSELI